jgi:thiol-disulfide isomerase/thioredoxin
MKTSRVLLLLATLVLICGGCAKKKELPGAEGAVTFDPAQPRAGAPVTVSYKPAGTPLKEEASVTCVAYIYTKGAPEAKSVPMMKDGSVWKATLSLGPADRGMILKFLAGDVVDNNGQMGYTTPFADAAGNPVAGSFAGLAEAYATWGKDLAGMNTDQDLALALLDKEFALHPEVKAEYLSPYFSLLARLKKEEGKAQILRELETLAARPGLGVEDLGLLQYWMARLNRPDESRRFAALLREKDPQGEFVQAERYQEFAEETDPAKKAALFERFKIGFPKSPLIPQFVHGLIAAFRANKDFDKAADFILHNPDGVSWSLYATLSSDFLKNKLPAGRAVELAARALDLARSEDAAGAKPPYLTEEEWTKEKNSVLGQALATQGEALLAVAKTGEAVQAFKEAVGRTNGASADLNTRYAELLVRLPGSDPAAALAEMEPFISSGNGTARLKGYLRQAFIKKRGTDSEFDAYLGGLEERAHASLLADLRRRIVDIPAAEFDLEDLEGNRVALSGLRGKVVVLDFWATWCAPCLSSFPAMKRLVEKHKDDSDVRFYFINTWERVADKKKNALDFLAKTSYPFRVLLDLENRAIDAFKVDGIPTKFVIDGKGRIRFKTIGYTGNPDRLIDEIEAMIEMAR